MGIVGSGGGHIGGPKALTLIGERDREPVEVRMVEHPPSVRVPRGKATNSVSVDSHLPSPINPIPSRPPVVRPSEQGLIILSAIASCLCLYVIYIRLMSGGKDK